MAFLGYFRRRLIFKIGIVTLFAIGFGFLGYALINSRRSVAALEAETRDSSEHLAHGLIAGIESAMLGGNGIQVADLIQNAQRELPTVSVHVFDTTGAPVFEPRGPVPDRAALPAPVRAMLAEPKRSAEGALIHRPVPNEPRCHACHDPKAALRGVLAIELDAGRTEAHRDEILGAVLTNAFEQVMTAKKTDLLDAYFKELHEKVPTIAGVAVYDADGSLTFGTSPVPASDAWKAQLVAAMKVGSLAQTVAGGDARVRIVPLPLEKRCLACHDEKSGAMRGALVVGFTPLAAGTASAELEGVVDTSLRTIMMSALGRLVTRYLATVSSTQATKQLRLYDGDGRLYYDAQAKMAPSSAVAAALATGKGGASEGADNSLTIVEPLRNEPRCQQCHGDDQPLRGAIEIRASTARAAEAREAAMSNALQFSLVTILVVFVLLWFALKRIVVDPVTRIGELAEQVGEGNLAVKEIRGAGPSGDEVARLGTRMNEMVHGLRTKLHLEKFVSKGTAEAAAGAARDSKGKLAGEGMRRRCTVLFTDIRGFTAYSERVEPEKVVSMLNRMLAAQSHCVEKFGGDIDKFVGDEVMAVFHGDDGPARAVSCALEMIDAVAAANEGEAISVGAGISYGDVVYGAIGAESRMDFTVIGDVVNTGARLCSRAAPHEILVSAPVKEHAGDVAAFEAVEPLQLKGKREPLETYRARNANRPAP